MLHLLVLLALLGSLTVFIVAVAVAAGAGCVLGLHYRDEGEACSACGACD